MICILFREVMALLIYTEEKEVKRLFCAEGSREGVARFSRTQAGKTLSLFKKENSCTLNKTCLMYLYRHVWFDI